MAKRKRDRSDDVALSLGDEGKDVGDAPKEEPQESQESPAEPEPEPTPASSSEPASSEPEGSADPGTYRGRPLRPESEVEGEDVAKFQRAINAWRPNALKVDGVYGPESAEVARSFQSNARIKADGVVGPVTWRALRRQVR